MKIVLAAILVFTVILGKGQKIVESFNPVIKQRPDDIGIKQMPDGNYLIYGDINYYAGEPCAALIKVDQQGVPIEEFQKVVTDHNIQNVEILPSGKILIHGIFKYLNGQRVGNLALLNEDGSVDPNFELDDGISVGYFTMQSDGKIVAFTNPTAFNALVRFNQDGSIDPTFDLKEYILLPLAIMANGQDELYIIDLFKILKLSKDGVVDQSFSFPVDLQKERFGPWALQEDGKIIMAVQNFVSNTFTLQRLHPDGTVDNSFHAGNGDSQITSICIRKNGKIAITGTFSQFDSHYGSAAELNADGSFSRSLLTVDFNDMFHIYEDNTENIFVTGGFAAVNSYTIKRIVKIKPNYEFDLSFKLPIDRTARDFLPLAAQSNDKLLIGGGSSFNGAGSDTSKIVRVLPDGNVDPLFSPVINEDHVPYYRGFVNAIAVQDDDKIIVGGGNIFDQHDNTLRRFLPDGQVDYTFQIGSGPSLNNGNMPATRFVKIKNSKIYIAGFFDRFNGTVCKSFVILDMQGNKIGPDQNSLPDDFQITEMEIQSDEKVIFRGFSLTSSTPGQKFLRLNLDGSIDGTFRLTEVNGNVIDMEIDENDNILLAGNSIDLDHNKILVRFNRDGDLDNSLHLGEGFRSGTSGFTSAYSVKALKNEMIAVTGIFSGYQNTSSPGVVIIDNNGSLIPFSNPFDSTTFVSTSTYANNTLYMIGRFSKNGTEVRSGAKIVFPEERVATGFKATATSASSIELSWKFVKTDDFIIEGRSPAQINYEVIATVPSGSESYDVQQLTEATKYQFKIKSANTPSGLSHFEGNETTWILPQVVSPATDITDNSFTANWPYLPGTDSCYLQVSDDDFIHFVEGYENLQATTGSVTVIGLDVDKQYQYRVKRFRNQKSTEYSDPMLVNLVTDVEQSLFQVNVFPNPVKDQLQIEFPERVGNGQILIHAIDGRLVGNYTFDNKARFKIDTSSLSRGVFIVTILSNGLTKKMKLVRSY